MVQIIQLLKYIINCIEQNSKEKIPKKVIEK